MKYLSHLFNIFIPPIRAELISTSHLNTILVQERERILTAMLRVTAVFGSLTLIVVLPGLIRTWQWEPLSLYVFFLGAVGVVAANRHLDYNLRAGIFLFISYTTGLIDLIYYGLGEDGRVFLTGFAIATTIFLGAQAGVGALILGTVTIAGIGWGISIGQLESLAPTNLPSNAITMEDVIGFCASFTLVAGLAMAALYAMLRGFELAWQREQLAATQLQQERDLLDQRVTERTHDLAQARDQALTANHLKTELLAKVSHELRTPLGAILGFTEMLEGGVYGPVSTQQQKITAEIIDSSRYLENLVNELLNEAQLEAGMLKLNLTEFNVSHLVHDVISKMNILAQAKGLSLTSQIAPQMPATLIGDPIRLQQILVNLVSNAIKFTQHGAIQVNIYCPNPDKWAIQVSDTGPGIPRQAQAYIFEPFRQVDGSVTRSSQGTGLGLSIVKQLTTLMGGKIMLDSVENCGSTFTVILPLHKNTSQINNGENTK